MACPLFKRMKTRGTSFFSFPSASEDMNLAFSNDSYKLNFTKFVLLNIPQQVVKTTSGQRDQTKGKLNFTKNQVGPNFYNFQPGGDSDLPNTLGEQMIESLRNYVANYDSTLRESRINDRQDFYNINEQCTPSEMIFWKWCKKLNLLDLEPAIHKVDWDKNLPDFDNANSNGTTYDYFQKYLWKERDVNYYDCTITQGRIGSITDYKPIVTISSESKFKVGDDIVLTGTTSVILTASTYKIAFIQHTTNETNIELEFVGNYTDSTTYTTGYVYLDYTPLIQYVGEIQAVSKIQTSRRNFTEVTAHIPHHAGKTPTVLFGIESNTNYSPGLEMPILPQEQQEEIVGSENTNSPIRLQPQNYPGTYYGYFDTIDKTYKCSSGDKLRYKGDYYGVLLSNNIGTDLETYFERLTDFNSDNIDGLKLDMDRSHYLKMNLPSQDIKNFDEFNSAYFDAAPQDFEFNAILWYYDLDDGSGLIINNLYGIEFLNNPSNDDECDPNNTKITTYKKLVSNGNQDGLSYIFNLNVNFNIDNDVLPMSYDPTTINNNSSFDLYQNILQTNAQLQESLLTIVSGFTYINEELFNLKSLVYSQTDMDSIKSQIENLNDLLQLYSTYQFVDSDTTTIETNFTGVYPTLKVNTISANYSVISDVNTSDIMYYNNINSGVSYSVQVPLSNQLLLNIHNNNTEFTNNATIMLNRDLAYKQSMEIFIKPNMSDLNNKLNINLYYNDGYGTNTEKSLISNLELPVDLIDYNTLNPTASTYHNSYYTNTNVTTYGSSITTGATTLGITLMNDLFDVNDYIYIDNFYLNSGSSVLDYSGVYKVSAHTTGIIKLSLPSAYMTMKTKPKISYYKGWKIDLLRISSSNTSSITDRYKITKTLL